jgi:hypothetical protein
MKPADHLQPLRDMPLLQQAVSCALPIIFTSLDHPEYPGMRGTCTALRFSNETVFVTAAHVIGRDNERTAVEVALGFQGDPVRCRIGRILKPRPSEEQFEAASDLAIMIPVSTPAFVEGNSAPHELNRVANLEAAPRGSVFCVCGYPVASEHNVIDYASRTITVGLHVAFGTYAAPSQFKGHHMLDVSTAEFGGPNGLSGGPVFRLLRDEDGTWSPSFAGIVTMGGPNRIHFIDVTFLGGFLLKEVFRSHPASRGKGAPDSGRHGD